jgi:hypothetical protein
LRKQVSTLMTMIAGLYLEGWKYGIMAWKRLLWKQTAHLNVLRSMGHSIEMENAMFPVEEGPGHGETRNTSFEIQRINFGIWIAADISFS